MEKYKVSIGICVDGDDMYWSMALLTVFSVFVNSGEKIYRLLVATKDRDKFRALKKILNFTGYRIDLIEPSPDLEDVLIPYQGGFSTYWKFDLFDNILSDELMLYLDIDAIVLNKLGLSCYFDKFTQKTIGVVPIGRAVWERYADLNLTTADSYFNAGVILGRRSDKYSFEHIKKSVNYIKQTSCVYWHDQDIFNYIFSNQHFCLPWSYNVHSGLLKRNGWFSRGYFKRIGGEKGLKIVHFSGSYISMGKYHPFMKHYARLIGALKCNYIKSDENLTSDACVNSMLLKIDELRVDCHRKRLFAAFIALVRGRFDRRLVFN